ncbi:hypothetical protein FQP90_09665 [Paenarthrobacter nitroguajacolicus]|uniref:Uncharacterized protein n=1 Tax=Paenarthrobacter nitroguajacolicus TaxID=211146 RepID=A0A558H298_PAENT|nr:hypothetical protein [Paenarthrobacter nitroguajacolicus]TVU63249.1 hypothetical protein FQP90_09665 [Paenarthrobacter nitroguajacolicus]
MAAGSGIDEVLLGSIAAGAAAWVVVEFCALLRLMSHQTIATTKTMTMTQINQSMADALLLAGVQLVVFPTLRACQWAVQRLTCWFAPSDQFA